YRFHRQGRRREHRAALLLLQEQRRAICGDPGGDVHALECRVTQTATRAWISGAANVEIRGSLFRSRGRFGVETTDDPTRADAQPTFACHPQAAEKICDAGA